MALKDLGLTLSQIAPLLDDLGVEQLRAMLALKRVELEQDVDAMRAQLERVERSLRHIEGADTMLTDVVVKHIPAMRVAAVPVDLPAFDQPDWDERSGPDIEGAYLHLLATLNDAGVAREGALFSFYEPLAGGSLQGYVATPVGEQALPADDRLVARELPAIDAACHVHRDGPSHAEVGPVYEQLFRWAEDHGYRAVGPGRDVILDGNADQTGIVLELQVPLER